MGPHRHPRFPEDSTPGLAGTAPTRATTASPGYFRCCVVPLNLSLFENDESGRGRGSKAANPIQHRCGQALAGIIGNVEDVVGFKRGVRRLASHNLVQCNWDFLACRVSRSRPIDVSNLLCERQGSLTESKRLQYRQSLRVLDRIRTRVLDVA